MKNSSDYRVQEVLSSTGLIKITREFSRKVSIKSIERGQIEKYGLKPGQIRNGMLITR